MMSDFLVIFTPFPLMSDDERVNYCWPQIRRQCFVGGQDLGTHLLHTIYIHANTCDTFNFCLLCMTWEMPSDLLLTLTFDVVKAGKCTWLI